MTIRIEPITNSPSADVALEALLSESHVGGGSRRRILRPRCSEPAPSVPASGCAEVADKTMCLAMGRASSRGIAPRALRCGRSSPSTSSITSAVMPPLSSRP